MGVAYDAGSKLRSNAGKIDIGQVISQAAQDAVHNVASMYAPTAIAMHLGPEVSDFVSGLMGGGKSPGSPAAAAAKQIVNKQVAAPAKAPTVGATITLPDGTKAQMPSAAFLAAHPATPYTGGTISAPSASAGVASAPTSPLDVVRAAAMANGGLSLNQLGALTESVSRMIPPTTQKPVTAKDQILGQYQSLANDYAVRTAQDPNYANTQGGKAHAALLQQLREGAASANSMFDVMNSGMPSSDQ